MVQQFAAGNEIAEMLHKLLRILQLTLLHVEIQRFIMRRLHQGVVGNIQRLQPAIRSLRERFHDGVQMLRRQLCPRNVEVLQVIPFVQEVAQILHDVVVTQVDIG